MKYSSGLIIALTLAIAGCTSHRGGWVSGTYDPDLDLKPEFDNQCTALSQKNIDMIKKMRLPGKRWVGYCKSCNDKEPTGPWTFGPIIYTQRTKIAWIFGPDKDSVYHAARMYVETDPNKFYSLAKLIGCPTNAASTEIILQ
jgi:hypothetical protein